MVSIAFTNGIGKAFVSIINLKHKLTPPSSVKMKGAVALSYAAFLLILPCLFYEDAFPNTEVVFCKTILVLGTR